MNPVISVPQFINCEPQMTLVIAWTHLLSSSLLLAMSLLQGDASFVVVDEAKQNKISVNKV